MLPHFLSVKRDIREINSDRRLEYSLDLVKILNHNEDNAGAQLTMIVPNTSANLTHSQYVYTPARAMMRDRTNYAKPLEFHGFRFVDPKLLDSLIFSNIQIPQPGQPSQLT